jgi:hypothetical protein
MATRKTIDRTTVVDVANHMIKYLSVSDLSDSGLSDFDRERRERREGIINVISCILIKGNSYKGFQYTHTEAGEPYDNTRISFL